MQLDRTVNIAQLNITTVTQPITGSEDAAYITAMLCKRAEERKGNSAVDAHSHALAQVARARAGDATVATKKNLEGCNRR